MYIFTFKHIIFLCFTTETKQFDEEVLTKTKAEHNLNKIQREKISRQKVRDVCMLIMSISKCGVIRNRYSLTPTAFSEVDTEEVTHRSNRKPVAHGRCTPFTTGDDGTAEVNRRPDEEPGDTEAVDARVDVEDAPPDGWPLRRVISIEEDHLPHLLQGDPNLLLHQLSEHEEQGGEEDGQADLQMSSMYPSSASLASADSPPLVRVKKPSKKKWIRGNMPSSARGQPVGKETLRQVCDSLHRTLK